ncbi:MAG TPA: hypothetical protein VKR06_08780 [Ktedonosporobacter sp.]|nr:hypothetical protein [Ktedonosporobacter sp.]
MTTVATLKQADVKQLVDDWYAKLDVHAPVEDLLPMLADQGLEMQFPEGIWHDKTAFSNWYTSVTNRFFDEIHTMKELSIAISGATATVQLVVNWQAHIWNPPAAKSEWLGFDAAQRWIVQASSQIQKPVIVTYIVQALTPMPGSATL